MKTLENNVQSLQQKQSSDRVEEALKNVRVLAGRPKLTSPSVLLAAMEVLVECAAKAGHPEADYFSKSLQTCRQFENHPDMCTLCLKLIGSSEDKKITNTVADWVKSKKYETKTEEKKDESVAIPKAATCNPFQSLAGYYPYPQFPAPCMPMGPPPGLGPMNFFGQAERQSFRPRMPKKKPVCFICKSDTHFVNNCPRVKKE